MSWCVWHYWSILSKILKTCASVMIYWLRILLEYVTTRVSLFDVKWSHCSNANTLGYLSDAHSQHMVLTEAQHISHTPTLMWYCSLSNAILKPHGIFCMLLVLQERHNKNWDESFRIHKCYIGGTIVHVYHSGIILFASSWYSIISLLF